MLFRTGLKDLHGISPGHKHTVLRIQMQGSSVSHVMVHGGKMAESSLKPYEFCP